MSDSARPPFELWTKFICTIGPSSFDKAVLTALAKEGANIFRYNFSHQDYDEYRAQKKIVQEINQELGTNVLMQADLQGPNIRVGKFPGGGVEIKAGGEYVFYTVAGQPGASTDILINDETLHLDVQPGQPITFMDGAMEGEIIKVEGNRITARMLNGGFLKDRKSVNVPDTILRAPAITEKDRKDLAFLMEEGVDILALSFIGARAEVDEIRSIVGDRPVKLITKVERKEAIKNIVEIIEASDGIMIARGDLGIELPMEEIPILQRTIISLCEHAGKPVITATQMMLSLTNNLRPTRAEVSDVANAVFARSDALMLSEETAAGIDPVNALRTMRKVAGRIEEYLYHRPNYFDK
jgi:pyruvate kinase